MSQTSPQEVTPQDANPLDSLLSLEDQYHTEGHDLGVADGARAGRIEGRTFGLQKGYEKFLEMGRLSGRAAVWNARLQSSPSASANGDDARLLRLQASERLRRHVSRLCDLTDPSTLSTENSEDAVEEFESRLKDARAKATLIAKAVGEDAPFDISAETSGSSSKVSKTKVLRVRSGAAKRGAGGGGEMEDFSGVLPITKSRTNREADA